MKIAFRKAKLNEANMARLIRINEIIEKYREMGYTLTLRQLYYQLVIETVIANNMKEYAKLIHLLTEGRMAGIVDWDGIEDRVRVPNLPYFNIDTDDAIKDAEENYRLDRQDGQENYIELWVEKDAISNILKVRTHHYGVHLMVNRGFSSTTAMFAAAERINRAVANGQNAHILYLGDHDPSGLCMALTDIPERLKEEFGVEVDVKHIGITMPQIKKYNPPTNPAKITDSRAKWYIKNWGNHSWEVDALEPSVLHTLINKEIEGLMDMDKFEEILKKEVVDKEFLVSVPTEIKKVPELHNKLVVATDDLNQCTIERNKFRDDLIMTTDELGTAKDDVVELTAKCSGLETDLHNEVTSNEKVVVEMQKKITIADTTAYNRAIDDVVYRLKKKSMSTDEMLKMKK